MFRFLILVAIAVAVGAALGGRLVELLSWALAFLTLLMLGDLLQSRAPRLRVRRRGGPAGA